MRTPFMPCLLLVTLLVVALVMACELTVVCRASADTDTDENSALDSLLGGGRLFIGNLAFDRADLYLHRGRGHMVEEAYTNRWLQRLSAQVSPPVVLHREGLEGIQAMLPWVELANQLAPTNTDYLLTQVYLLKSSGDLKGALRVLRRARVVLPNAPEPASTEARLLLRLGRWQEAAHNLDICMRLSGTNATTVSSDNLDIWAEAAMLRGLLYENAADTNAAIQYLSHAATMAPAQFGAFSNRVAMLRSGQTPNPPAHIILEKYRGKNDANPLEAAHHHHHGAHDDHDDDHD